MKVFAIGASRNIGYYATSNLLAAGHSVAFLLRSPKIFDEDEEMQKYIKGGKATIFKGDALSRQDVENAWKGANEGSNIDLVIFSLGGTPKFQLSKGLVISPANLTTHSLSNILQTIAANRPGNSPKPRLVAVTSTGVTKASHDALPFGWKLLYSYGLSSPHADKLGMERLLQHAMGHEWHEQTEPSEEILHSSWKEEYPPSGWLPELVIVRPAFLTDGEEKGNYKTSTDEFASWVISRRDVGHFIGKKLVNEWSTWSGKIVNVGY